MSLIVWGAIMFSGHKTFIREKGIVNSQTFSGNLSVHLPGLIPSLGNKHCISQQENAHAHTSRPVVQSLQQNSILPTA